MTRQSDLSLVNNSIREAADADRSLYDLANSRAPYPELIPLLTRLLDRVQDFGIKEMVVRALTSKEARGMVEEKLIDVFLNTPIEPETDSLRWAIGNAIYSLKPAVVEDGILSIVKDANQGAARQMFVLSMPKLRNPTIFDCLIELLKDRSVRGHAISALRVLKDPRAVASLEAYTKDQNPWIRREATKAIAALVKRS